MELLLKFYFHFKQLTINQGIAPIGIMKAKNATLMITNQFVLDQG